MYTIDLLKGKGKPIKSNPGLIGILAIPFVIEAVIAIMFTAHYVSAEIKISTQNMKLNDLNKKLQNYTDDLKFHQDYEKQLAEIDKTMSSISDHIGKNIQWTPVLVKLVENLPGSVIFRELDVKKNSTSEKIKDPEDSNKQKTIDVVQRSLMLTLFAKEESADESIQSFMNNVKKDTFFNSILEEMRIISQKEDKYNNRTVIEYQIECQFKKQK